MRLIRSQRLKDGNHTCLEMWTHLRIGLSIRLRQLRHGGMLHQRLLSPCKRVQRRHGDALSIGKATELALQGVKRRLVHREMIVPRMARMNHL